MAAGNLSGVLDVQSTEKDAFNKTDIDVIRVLADQLAAAIENTRLFEATHRQIEELTVLHNTALVSVQATDEDEIIKNTTQLIGETLYPNNFGVLLLDEKEDTLIHHPSYWGDIVPNQPSIHLDDGITGAVARTGEPMLVPDVTKNPHYLEVDTGTRAELCVPLRIGNNIIGVINTESHKVGAFNEKDEQLLTTVAVQLGTAIEKSRLLEVEQRRIEELAGLHDIAQAFGNLTDVRETYGAIAERLAKLIDASMCIVTLYDPKTKEFVAEAPGYGVSDKIILATRYSAQEAKQVWDYREKGVYRANSRKEIPPLFDAMADLFKVESIIVAPIISEGRILGAVFVANKSGGFSENDARLLSVFANQTGTVIVNARLYADTQKRTKELAIALTRQEELDRLKDEFIQKASNELRTPISIVKGYIELLNNGELGETPDNYKQPIQTITRNINILDYLIENLTAILETQALGIKREHIDLTEITTTILDGFELTAETENLSIEKNIEEDLPKIWGDEKLIRLVIDNLLNNAIKFSPVNGTITVNLRRDIPNMILEVADNGLGVPEDQFDQIFERFFQIKSNSGHRYGGVGLGLALVKEIIETHGGEVKVQSVLGEGSKFSVIIPENVNEKETPEETEQ